MVEVALNRKAAAERGKRLEYFTIAWNSLEGLVALTAGALAGSISLVGFGIDSFIEVTSGTVLLWRSSVDADVRSRERNERLSLRIVGVCFLALAVYVGYKSVSDLVYRKTPEHSLPGIVLALEGVEGKLFRPMALTVVFALLGSLLMTFTATPVLMSLLLKREREKTEPLLMRKAMAAYEPILHWSLSSALLLAESLTSDLRPLGMRQLPITICRSRAFASQPSRTMRGTITRAAIGSAHEGARSR